MRQFANRVTRGVGLVAVVMEPKCHGYVETLAWREKLAGEGEAQGVDGDAGGCGGVVDLGRGGGGGGDGWIEPGEG